MYSIVAGSVTLILDPARPCAFRPRHVLVAEALLDSSVGRSRLSTQRKHLLLQALRKRFGCRRLPPDDLTGNETPYLTAHRGTERERDGRDYADDGESRHTDEVDDDGDNHSRRERAADVLLKHLLREATARHVSGGEGQSGRGSGAGSVPSSGGGVGGVPSSGGVGSVPSSGGGDGSGTWPGSSIVLMSRPYPGAVSCNRPGREHQQPVDVLGLFGAHLIRLPVSSFRRSAPPYAVACDEGYGANDQLQRRSGRPSSRLSKPKRRQPPTPEEKRSTGERTLAQTSDVGRRDQVVTPRISSNAVGVVSVSKASSTSLAASIHRRRRHVDF